MRLIPSANTGGGESAAKPSVSVINNSPRITINANDPVVILTADIQLQEASKLLISGVINGTFHYVCGIAAYIDGTPINLGTGNNRCHSDCFQVMYGNGNNGWMSPRAFETVSPILDAGNHRVKIGVIGKWAGRSRTMYINNRSSNDMASSSSLIVRAL